MLEITILVNKGPLRVKSSIVTITTEDFKNVLI